MLEVLETSECRQLAGEQCPVESGSREDFLFGVGL